MLSDFLPFVVAGIATGAVLGLAGTGLVLTYKTSGIFNFGHGAIAAAAAYGFYWLNQTEGWPWWLAFILIAGVLGPALGLLIEAVANPLSGQRVTFKIVATVGLILVVQGIATVKYGFDPLQLPQYLPNGNGYFRLDGVSITYAQVTITVVSLIAVAALYLLFRFSRIGLAMRAIVDDPSLVELHATNGRRVRRIAWITGSVLAALSGLLIAPLTNITATSLVFLVVEAFGAAALGAFSSIPLTYVGALIIGVLSGVATKYVINFPAISGLPTALPFVFLMIVLMVLPRRKLVPPARAEALPRAPWTAPPLVRVGAGVVAIGLLFCIPSWVGVNLSYYTVGLTQAIILLSLGLLVRTAGMVSLCQGAFAAAGAAAFSQLVTNLHLPWLVGVLLGALIVVPVAALLALPAIRLSGLFLALATFGFGLMAEQLIYNQSWFFTHAQNGRDMPRPSGFTSDRAYYYVVAIFLIAAALVMVAIHRGRIGRILRGVGESPLAVRTLGLNVNLTRLLVFSIAGYMAGIGGILYGSSVHFAVLGDAHYSAYSSLVLLATLAVVPGREPWYALIAAVAAVVPAYWTDSNASNWLNVMFGFFAVLVAIQGGTTPMPRVVQELVERVGRPRKTSAAPVVATPKAQGAAPMATARRQASNSSGLEVRNLTVRYGGHVAVDKLSFTASMGEITGLIGPNGAGKTTTFNALSGIVRPSSGEIVLHGKDVSHLDPAGRGRTGLGRTFQLMQLCGSLTVSENVSLGAECALAGSNVRGQLFATRAEQRHTREAVEDALELCGIVELRNRPAGTLSTGQRRLVELARCLSGPFDMLLLDEPSSGLDVAETERFGETLQTIVGDRGCGILLVEHDMALVLNICSQVNVLDFGKFLFRGTPSEVVNSSIVQSAYLGSIEVGDAADVSRKELAL